MQRNGEVNTSKLRIVIGGVLVFAFVAVLSLVLLRSSASGTEPAQPVSEITIRASNMQFDLNTITAKVGQPITIRLENDDDMNHSFAIDALKVYTEEVRPNQTVSVTFTPQEVGTYEFRCPLFRHDKLGMVGTFEVVP
jgi:plastocyanin